MNEFKKIKKKIDSFHIVRGLAVLFMIAQHIIIMYSSPATTKSFFGESILLLGTAPAAPIFMFIMGLFFIYSAPKTMIQNICRGLKLIALGYILNFLRFTVPLSLALATNLCTTKDLLPNTMMSLFFTVDILQFAGVAVILMTLVSALFKKPLSWGLLACLTTIISPFLWGKSSNITALNILFDLFWGKGVHIDFPIFPWIAYPLIGMLFGHLFLKTQRQKNIFTLMLKTGLTLVVFGTIISLSSIEYHFGDYHRSGIGGVLFIMGFILIWLPFFEWLSKKFKKNLIFDYLTFLSKNITYIYIIQWLLIGWGVLIFDTNKQYAGINSIQIVTCIILTSLLVFLYRCLARKIKKEKIVNLPTTKISSFIIIMILCSSVVSAEPLTLEKYLKTLQKNNPFLQKEEISINIAKKEKQSITGKKEWSLSQEGKYGFQKNMHDPLDSIISSLDNSRYGEYTISMEKALWSTGGTFSMGADFSHNEYRFTKNNQFTLPRKRQSHTSKYFLSYKQSLLKNFGGVIDRLEEDLKKYDIAITKITTKEKKEKFLLEASIQFLEWSLLDEKLRITNEQYLLANKQLKQLQKKAESDLTEKIDVLRAQEHVLIAKQNKILVNSQWKAKQSEVMAIAKIDNKTQQTPNFNLYKSYTLPGLDILLMRFKSNSRIIQSIKEQKNKLIRLQKGNTNNLKPDLSLVVSGGIQDQGNTLKKSVNGSNPYGEIRLECKIPLGNQTAKAQKEKTSLEIDQLGKYLSHIEQEFEKRLSPILIQSKQYETILRLSAKRIACTHKKIKEEEKRYQQGRSELFQVIQNRHHYEEAKLAYAQIAFEYQLLLLQYKELMDELYKPI